MTHPTRIQVTCCVSSRRAGLASRSAPSHRWFSTPIEHDSERSQSRWPLQHQNSIRHFPPVAPDRRRRHNRFEPRQRYGECVEVRLVNEKPSHPAHHGIKAISEAQGFAFTEGKIEVDWLFGRLQEGVADVRQIRRHAIRNHEITVRLAKPPPEVDSRNPSVGWRPEYARAWQPHRLMDGLEMAE